MIAAKVKRRESGAWHAWLGVTLEHIQRDVETMGGFYARQTLEKIPVQEVIRMDYFHQARNAVRRVENASTNPPFLPGSSSFYLGILCVYDTHREPVIV